jgi:hypothetical protein
MKTNTEQPLINPNGGYNYSTESNNRKQINITINEPRTTSSTVANNNQGVGKQVENNMASLNTAYQLRNWKYQLSVIAGASFISICSEFLAYYCWSPKIENKVLSDLAPVAVGYGVNYLCVEAINLINGHIKAACHIKNPNNSSWQNNAESVYTAVKNHGSTLLDMAHVKMAIHFAIKLLKHSSIKEKQPLIEGFSIILSNIATCEKGHREWWYKRLFNLCEDIRKAMPASENSQQETNSSSYSGVLSNCFSSFFNWNKTDNAGTEPDPKTDANNEDQTPSYPNN